MHKQGYKKNKDGGKPEKMIVIAKTWNGVSKFRRWELGHQALKNCWGAFEQKNIVNIVSVHMIGQPNWRTWLLMNKDIAIQWYILNLVHFGREHNVGWEMEYTTT